jgi:hypothetical protein
VPEHLARDDAGNVVRYRTEHGFQLLKGSEQTFIAADFVALIPDSQGGPDLHMRVKVRDGVPRVREVLIQSRPDGRDVWAVDLKTAADLEGLLKIAAPLAAAHGVDVHPGGVVESELSFADSDMENVRTAISRARRNTRRKLTDEQLHEVAAVYDDAANDAAPVQAVKDTFTLSERSAYGYIARAREAGLIKRPPRRNRG